MVWYIKEKLIIKVLNAAGIRVIGATAAGS